MYVFIILQLTVTLRHRLSRLVVCHQMLNVLFEDKYFTYRHNHRI